MPLWISTLISALGEEKTGIAEGETEVLFPSDLLSDGTRIEYRGAGE
jgi:hypothetical protein